jgi:hypothetical protein
MTIHEILSQLESMGNEKVRAHNLKFGAGSNQFGVKMGDIRALGKENQNQSSVGVGALGNRKC